MEGSGSQVRHAVRAEIQYALKLVFRTSNLLSDRGGAKLQLAFLLLWASKIGSGLLRRFSNYFGSFAMFTVDAIASNKQSRH